MTAAPSAHGPGYHATDGAAYERFLARATAHGLEADFLRALYDLLIEEASRTENRLMAAPKSRPL